MRNVELVFCWVPTLDDIEEGVHRVVAVGNDAMAAEITVDTEESLKYAGELVQLTQLKWLGNILMKARYEETVAGMPALVGGDI